MINVSEMSWYWLQEYAIKWKFLFKNWRALHEPWRKTVQDQINNYILYSFSNLAIFI